MIGNILVLLMSAALSMEIYPSVKEVKIGEPFEIEIVVNSPADAELAAVEPMTPAAHIFSSKTTGSKTLIEMAVYENGKVEVPLKIYYTASGQQSEIESKGFMVEVIPAAEENTPVSGSRGVLYGFEPAYLIIIILLIVAFAALIIYSGRKKVTPEPVLTPFERAMNKLNEIKGSDLIAEGDYKGYYDGISDCLRGYIDEKYGLQTLGATLNEIQQILKSSAELLPSASRLGELLKDCDHIKFAPEGRAPSTIETVWNAAEKLINEI